MNVIHRILLLMASLYKFESKAQRRDGFFNGIILNESYVIGANRNEYLNLLSLVIFVGVYWCYWYSYLFQNTVKIIIHIKED